MLLTRLQLAIAGVVIALLLAALVYESVSLRGFLWIDGALDNLEECDRNRKELRAELDRISAERNRQKQVTERNIDKARDSERDAKGRADRIRNAPLPGNCETPREIMESKDI